jgi:hypothetical protein
MKRRIAVMVAVRAMLLASVVFAGEAPAFYSPAQGRWLSRDPLGDPLIRQSKTDRIRDVLAAVDHDDYMAMSNDAVDVIDPHGLLTWRKQVCAGCNAGGIGIWEGMNYEHVPKKETDSPCRWEPGSGGSQAHTCWLTGAGGLCDTDTHITIEAKNDTCCLKWRVRCSWSYNGQVSGRHYASFKLKADFLGAPVPGIPPSAYWRYPSTPIARAASGLVEKIVVIPFGGTVTVFHMVPMLTGGNAPARIEEATGVYCTADCVSGGP